MTGPSPVAYGPSNIKMNERRKLGAGQNVQNDRLWVKVPQHCGESTAAYRCESCKSGLSGSSNILVIGQHSVKSAPFGLGWVTKSGAKRAFHKWVCWRDRLAAPA